MLLRPLQPLSLVVGPVEDERPAFQTVLSIMDSASDTASSSSAASNSEEDRELPADGLDSADKAKTATQQALAAYTLPSANRAARIQANTDYLDEEEGDTEVEELLDEAPQHSPRPHALLSRTRNGSVASTIFPIDSLGLATQEPSLNSLEVATEASSSGLRSNSPVTSLFASARYRHPADNGTDRSSTPIHMETEFIHPEIGTEAEAETEIQPPSFDDSQRLYANSGALPSPAPFRNLSPASGVERPAMSRSASSSRSALGQNVDQGTFISVANSHLARLAADQQQIPSSNNPNRRSFFSTLFSQNSRNSPNTSTPHSPNRNSSPAFSTANSPFLHQHHNRTCSSPLPSPMGETFLSPPSQNQGVRRSGTLTSSRSASPSLQPISTQNPPIGLGLGTGSSRSPFIKQAAFFGLGQSSADVAQSRLEEIGVRQDPITTSLSLSRNGQPTCGTVLDDKYLLIGTTSGLDFLPLDYPDQKRPIPLIKRTRFKQLTILKERSNILLAVAGRNDHVRVYALDGVRAMIERKMKEVSAPSLARVIVNVASGNPPLAPMPSTSSLKTNEGIKRNGSTRAGRPAPLTLNGSLSNSSTTPLSPPPPYPPASPARVSARRGLPSRNSSSATLHANARRTSIVSTLPANVQPGDLTRHRSRDSLRSLRRGSAATIVPIRGTTNAAPTPVELAESSNEADTEDAEWDCIDENDARSECTSEQPCKMPNSFQTAQTSHSDENEAGDRLAPLSPRSPASPRSTRMMARSGSRENDSAFTNDLASFLRDASPVAPALKRAHSSRARLTAREPSTEDSPSMRDLADFFKSEPPTSSLPASTSNGSFANSSFPSSSTQGSLSSVLSGGSSAASVTTLLPEAPQNLQSTTSSPNLRLTPRAASASQTEDTQALADFFRTLPPEMSDRNQTMARSNSGASWSTEANNTPDLSHRHTQTENSGNTLEVGARSRKRWSMFEGLLGQSPSASPSMPSTAQFPRSPSLPPANEAEDEVPLLRHPTLTNNSAEKSPRPADPEILEPAVDSGIDASTGSTSAIMAEKHPASANAPLEFVKLARTKGTKMIRSVETKQRTFLAVLCGESGERIELFTGARNVSLSLNRTFVLPESPKAIEFQLQGDELVDIYLMYEESIFALEPSTVRVREVGVLRNERRVARRERERERQNSSTGAERPEMPLPPVQTESSVTADTSSPSRLSVEQPPVARISEQPISAKNMPPFTTFQQLPFIPPVPSSVLAPAYVIPPTYSDVIEASPNPNGELRRLPIPIPSGGTPLLSPISLLANHPARASGPPGLFFVSRGRTSTSIVDGDGRSVIKKPIHWLDEDDDPLLLTVPESLRHLRHLNRIEIMITEQGTTSILVGLSPTEVTAIAVGDTLRGVEILPDNIAKKRKKATVAYDSLRDVVFLGASGSRIYWAERLSNHVQIHRLSGHIA